MWEQVSTRSRKSFWMSLKLFSYLCAIHATTQGLANNHRKVLTIGGLYASGAMTTWQNGSGIVKTVNEAIRFINERSQLLPGYKLEIEWRDTKVSASFFVMSQNFNLNVAG